MIGSTDTYSEPTPNSPGVYQRKPSRLFKQDSNGARDDTLEGVQEAHDDSTDDAENEYLPSTFPEWVISGVAGKFARLYSNYIEPPAEFFFVSFLTCLGSILANRVTLASEIEQQPRLYTLLLGQSADVRKSTAISKTYKFFKGFFEEFFAADVSTLPTAQLNVMWGVGSAEGLQKGLEESSPLLLVLDELKAFMGKCKIQSSVLLPCVNTLFEQNDYQNKTAKSDIKLEGAYLSLLAACTVETYERTWDESFTDIGFTNRIFIVPADGDNKRFSMPRKVPERQKQEIKLLLYGMLQWIGERLELDMTESARRAYDEWYNNLERSIHTRRLDTYAVRFMILLAINDFKTEIDEETVKKATALMNWQLAMRRQYDPIEAETKIAKMEQKIMRRLEIRPHDDRKLRQYTNASRCGIRIYQWAIQNLRNVKDIEYDSEKKMWKKCE